MFYGRGLNKVRNLYHLEDIYTYYLERDPFKVSHSLYMNIIRDYLKASVKRIFDGYIYRMPAGLGTVSIAKLKMKYDKKNTLTPDWANTIKYGKLIRHLNEHSKGFRYRFHWFKKGITFNSDILYRLVMTRANKRELARIIKLGEMDYIQLV